MTTLNPVDEAFTRRLREALPDDCLRPAEAKYLAEPRGRFTGQPTLVALPRSVEQVSALLRVANAARVGVIPYGGGTGLVGGQVAPDGPAPLVLSLERMNRIHDVRPDENIIVAQAGVILAQLQHEASQLDRLFPLSLASEGTAQIGGCLATNAGGVNVLRYGNARDLCLGLEVVLADGRIWNGLKRLRKDNTGYDLRNLMIGSEGTLGVITAAVLRLMPRPVETATAFLSVASPADALAILGAARDIAGDGVSAFELMHREGLAFLAETYPDIRQPFSTPPEWSVLIELGMARGSDAKAVLMRIFEHALEAQLCDDGQLAQSEAQRQAFWSVREHIPEANRRIGAVSSHDISLPLAAISDFIERARIRIANMGPYRINCFGHLGDGNLHFNAFPPAGSSASDHMAQRDDVKRTIHDLVHACDGSVSAEHGIGRLKVGDLERYTDPVKLDLMRRIKTALDPNGILNPGAILG